MYTDRSEKSKKLNFYKHSQLKFVQEFVQTKINNPDFIRKLKQNQLRKIQVKKAKLQVEVLKCGIEKAKQKLKKAQEEKEQLTEYHLRKDKQFLEIQYRTLDISGKISQLLNEQSQPKDQRHKQIKLFLIQLKNESQKLKKQIQEEHSKHNLKIQTQSEKISTLKQKIKILKQQFEQKVKLFESIKSDETSFLFLKIKKEETINQLKCRKQTLSLSIKQKKALREENILKIKQIQSENYLAQVQCIRKLGNFVNQLKQIIDSSVYDFDEKKNMFELLLNVYCSSSEQNEIMQKSEEKCNHDSLETKMSLKQVIKSNEMFDQFDENSETSIKEFKCQIPQKIILSLKELQKSSSINKVLTSILSSSPNLSRKHSSNSQQQHHIKTLSPQSRKAPQQNRNSLPTSLNQNDLREQFQKYLQSELNKLNKSINELDKKQQSLDKQISTLTKKGQQKDSQIDCAVEMNRKSLGKI